MIRILLPSMLSTIVAPSVTYGALTIKTERKALCGVELYEERYDGDVCGWLYKEKQSNACGLDYYVSGADLSCPGTDTGGRVVTVSALNGIQWDSVASRIQGGEDLKVAIGFNPDFNTFGPFAPGGGGSTKRKELNYWTCDLTQNVNPQFSQRTLKCTAKPYVATCALAKFGSVYKLCRHESHGKESPKKCRSDRFAAELYNSCSFYKTPEEIDAFIEATYASLAINTVSLPSKQADLYGSFRQEASFICLIEKYKALEGYDDVVLDLMTKFKNAFGYEHTESSRTCADSANEAVPPRITAGTLDCASYTIQTIKTLAKPDTMNTAVFTRFKSTCTAKLSYDFALSWFDEKLAEINQLLADIVARQDSERKAQLESLRTSVSESN